MTTLREEMLTEPVFKDGFVTLLNVAGPVRRPDQVFDGSDRDPPDTARMSFGQRHTRSVAEDLKLADYLYRHRHTTPFEMVVTWWDVQLPIFVARQFIRHRTVTVNEVSGRYTILPDKFYIPTPIDVGRQSGTNKQGRTLFTEYHEIPEYAFEYPKRLEDRCKYLYQEYLKDIEEGVPKELARIALPFNIYTRWVWKQDLHNICHMLALRQDPHAQYEAQRYATAKYQLLKRFLPETMKLLDKYGRDFVQEYKPDPTEDVV